MTDTWLEPWHPADDERDRGALENELRREVSAQHPLWQQNARLIARRYDQEDALFLLDDGRVAEVHLTWKGSVEHPGYPRTLILPDLEEWRLTRMEADAAEWRLVEE